MKSTDGRCLARLQPRLYEGHGHVLFLIESLAVSQVSARHKKHDMEIVCIPVVLFLFWPLVDELNSLCLVDHSSSSKRHKVSPPGSNLPLSQTSTCTCQSMPLHHMKGINDIPIATCAPVKKSHIRPQHMHATTPTVESFFLPPPTAPHPPNQRAHHRMTSAHRQRRPQPSRSSRQLAAFLHPQKRQRPPLGPFV